MSLDIQYGNLRYNDREYMGITGLIRSIGLSPQLVNWEIEKAVLRFKKELDSFQKGDINGTEFNRRTKTPNLRGEAKEARNVAAKVGTQRHSMLEAFATGDTESLAFYRETMAFQFTALEAWLTQNEASILLSEFQVANDEIMVHGRSDVYIKTKKGNGVYDLKSKQNVYLEQKLQVAFYAKSNLALTQAGEQKEFTPEFASILTLTDRGIQETEVTEVDACFELLRLYRQIHEQKKVLAA